MVQPVSVVTRGKVEQLGFRIAAKVLRPGDAIVAVQAVDLARRGRIGGVPRLVVLQAG